MEAVLSNDFLTGWLVCLTALAGGQYVLACVIGTMCDKLEARLKELEAEAQASARNDRPLGFRQGRDPRLEELT